MVQRQTTTTVQDSVEFTASVTQNSHVSQPVDLVLALTNRGKVNIYWGEIDGVRDCLLRVYDNRGRPVPYTRAGEARIATAGYSTYRRVVRVLEPNESKYWKYNLVEFFDLNRGSYKLTASIEINFPDGPELTVADLEFHVK